MLVKRIYRIVSMCMAVAVLLSLLFISTGNSVISARPDKLKWSVVDTPSSKDKVIVSPGEINDFVAGSDYETFYALDIPGWHDDDEDDVVDAGELGRVFKTTDAGLSWDDELTETLQQNGALLPAWDIAVAPGDSDIVAVVTDNRQEVYVSEYGGEVEDGIEEVWVDTRISNAPGWDPNLLISDIAISPKYDGDNRDIAIGTRKPDGATGGDVWVVKSNIFGGWEAQNLDMDVSSVRFSPGYSSDGALLVIASDDESTYLCTGIRYIEENETDWEVTEPAKVEISTGTGLSPGEGELISSDLSLPSNYYYQEEAPEKRVVYAAYWSDTDADDVYRIEDTDVYRLEINNGKKVSIASIDYQGSYSGGELLVGEVLAEEDSASALLRFCTDPEESLPEWQEPDKAPTGGVGSGNANAVVLWGKSGNMAYCGTSSNYLSSAADWADMTFGPWRGEQFDESAFSVTEDSCVSWNQLGLIDTEMKNLCDYLLSFDRKTLYLASVGNGFDSLWRSESDSLGESWQRVLCFDGESDDVILRVAEKEASNKELLFLAVKNSDDARYSDDNWQTWKSIRSCPDITDMAVADDELLYILDDNLVHKGVWDERRYGGDWVWTLDLETELEHGYSIAVSGSKNVFVGEDGGEGKLAYSTNKGDSFELTDGIPEPGKMVLVADEDFTRKRFVYVASDDSSSGVYRWAVNAGTEWEGLNPPNRGFSGLAHVSGALYGTPAGGIDRTLVPHEDSVDEEDWDSLTENLAGGVSFRSGTLRAMLGDQLVDLWAIDERPYYNGTLDPDEAAYNADTGRLWVYSDTFVLSAPWPTSPAIGELLPCDPCNCKAEIFCFNWRKLSLALEYDVWVALDEDFSFRVIEAENIRPDDSCNPAWCLPSEAFDLDCGDTYYWKVRGSTSCGGDRVHSRWSPPVRFTIMAGSNRGGMHIAPVLVAPESGADGVLRSPAFSWTGFPHIEHYEFILASDASLTQVLVKEIVPTSAYLYRGELDWGATYFWQVKAIQPVMSEASNIGVFTVETQVQQQQAPAIVGPPVFIPRAAATPSWVWWIIGVLTALNIVVIVSCMVRR
jgi:hypothetical protein